MNNKVIHFESDKPISTPAEDVLDRVKFSKEITDVILNWDENESLVISIDGPWGSGKTSQINLIKDQLSKTDKNIWKIPAVFEFNPWLFSDFQNLIKIFLNEIAKQLKSRNKSEDDVR